MRELLVEAEASYDLVVIDTPPPAILPDAVPVLNQACDVLVVARVGHTVWEAARELQSDLDRLGARVIGVVLNGKGDPRERYASWSTTPLADLWRRRQRRRDVGEGTPYPVPEEPTPATSDIEVIADRGAAGEEARAGSDWGWEPKSTESGGTPPPAHRQSPAPTQTRARRSNASSDATEAEPAPPAAVPSRAEDGESTKPRQKAHGRSTKALSTRSPRARRGASKAGQADETEPKRQPKRKTASRKVDRQPASASVDERESGDAKASGNSASAAVEPDVVKPAATKPTAPDVDESEPRRQTEAKPHSDRQSREEPSVNEGNLDSVEAKASSDQAEVEPPMTKQEAPRRWTARGRPPPRTPNQRQS